MGEELGSAKGHPSGHDNTITTGLNSGILYATSGTGLLSIAVSGTDYESGIPTGTSGQFFRGDKTWALVPDTGGGIGVEYAPTGASYIVQISNATLTNEQAIANLDTGILKGASGTGLITIAVSGTDFEAPLITGTSAQFYRGDKTWQLVPDTGTGGAIYAPTGATYIVQVASATLTNEQVLADLNTGILKSTSGTGLISIASSSSDYEVWIPTGTTAQFYRGDKTWNTPAGGSEAEIIVRLAGNVTSTGTALKSCAGFEWSLGTSTDYLFEFHVLYTTSSTASGINLGLTGPVGRTALGALIIANNAVTALTLAGRQIKDYTTTGLTFTACVTGVNYATIQGVLMNGLTAGTCTMLYASEVATVNTTIFAGSVLRYRQTNP